MTVEQIISLADEGFKETVEVMKTYARSTLNEYGSPGTYGGIDKTVNHIERMAKKLEGLAIENSDKETDFEKTIGKIMYPKENEQRTAMLSLTIHARIYLALSIIGKKALVDQARREDLKVKAQELKTHHEIMMAFPFEVSSLIRPLAQNVETIIGLANEI